jgi:hypothetical protein
MKLDYANMTPYTRKLILDFTYKILHGEERHRQWLLKAAENYVAGKEVNDNNPYTK